MIPLLIGGTAVAIAALAANAKKGKTSAAVELDEHLPTDKVKQVLGAIAHEKVPATLNALADKLDAQGFHLAAAALRERAADLTASGEAPPPAPIPGVAAQPPPSTAIVPPSDHPQVTPSGIPSLDPGMDATTRQAVIAALTSVNDPAQLQGFASSIAGDYPLSAALLWAKAAAIVANHPAPVSVEQAAPPRGVIAPGPAAQPVVQVSPQGYSWRLASNADVARDGVQSRYQSLMSSPIGTQIQEMHNGRAWQFRVISKTTDPGLTTYARDVKGWIGTPYGQLAPAPAPTSMAAPAPAHHAPPASVPAAYHPGPTRAPVPVTTNPQVQSALTQLGYGPLKVDGIIGPASQAAVKKFQADHGLKVDGIPGPVTKTALATALAQKGLGVAA
jgi:murein L,D-transpeptidase YcbB/YkuD